MTVTKPVVVTVLDENQDPYSGFEVYAFDGEIPTGFHAMTDANGQANVTVYPGNYRFAADIRGTLFWSGGANHCQVPGCESASVGIPGGYEYEEVTIDYTYDGLYRLTAADYSNDDYFHYSYDAAGNRLSEDKVVNGLPLIETDYAYDVANRLVEVDEVEYTWDANGNLLDDGLNEYSYDPANRLIGLTDGQDAYSFTYNGLGDRLGQTVNAETTTYLLDLNAGLTQVLYDGTNSYTYGLGRISQESGLTPEYFLGDALGSVRQMTHESSAIVMSKAYDPYGSVISTTGNVSSMYAYAGEQMDSFGMVFLRARYYDLATGRFLSRDTWDGSEKQPASYNLWNYAHSNPAKFTDPSGHRVVCPWGWNDWAVDRRVDEAEKYVSHTSDPMDTYTAAGIAIQCAGWDNPFDPNSGVGIAQISKNQAETEWGEEIIDEEGNFRGYGLRLCLDGRLEKALNPNDTKDAVVLMKRRIQLVTNECKGCTATDIFIAAGLAQNGPGFTHKNMKTDVPELTPERREKFEYPDVNKDWFRYFERDAEDRSVVNTKTQLNRFVLVMNELRSRRWIVPYIDSTAIDVLKD